jgi:hypothetical protein
VLPIANLSSVAQNRTRPPCRASGSGAAFGDFDDAVHPDILEDIGAAADPSDFDPVDPRALAEAEVGMSP